MTSRWKISESALEYIYPEYKKSYLIPDLLIFTTVFLCEIKKTRDYLYHYENYYVNGLKHGMCKEWYINRSIKSKSNYVYGVKHGRTLRWHSNKMISDKIDYAKGLYHGKYKIWDNIGNLRFNNTFVKGIKNGRCKKWSVHSPKQIIYDDIFVNGEEHGMCKEWDKYGTLVFHGMYINGVKQADCDECDISINSVNFPCHHMIFSHICKLHNKTDDGICTVCKS